MASQEHPHFNRPPVIEVALSIAFAPLEGFGTAQMGLLWGSKYRTRFPRVEEQASYDPPIETFGPPTPLDIGLQIVRGTPSPRLWFVDEQGNELVQIQPNWFARNWRRVSTDDAVQYPRYTQVRGAFETDLRHLVDFLNEEGLPEIVPSQCEITYVNHVESGQIWSKHSEIDRVFNVWTHPASLRADAELVRFQTQYRMPSPEKPLGRLHVRADPSFRRKDNLPLFVLNVTARGAPQGQGIDGALAFLDVAHEWALGTFMSITTEAMHEIWELQDGD